MANTSAVDLAVLRSIRDGADIYSRALAKHLRSLHEAFPELIEITEPMMYDGDGTDQVPYFGAILTQAGKNVVEGLQATAWDDAIAKVNQEAQAHPPPHPHAS